MSFPRKEPSNVIVTKLKKHGMHIEKFLGKKTTFFVNSNEWHLKGGLSQYSGQGPISKITLEHTLFKKVNPSDLYYLLS